MSYDHEWYTRDYFLRPVNASLHLGLLKVQDEAAALCYALGAAADFQAVERLLLGKEGEACMFEVSSRPPGYVPAATTEFLEDTAVVRGESVRAQLERVRPHIKRRPRLVIDVGGGAGILCSALSYFEVPSVLFEPAASAAELFAYTHEKSGLPQRHVRLVSELGALEGLLAPLDTVIFCSSLEHLSETDREALLALLVPRLQEHAGLLIVVNTPTNHPIAAGARDHISRVDDTLFAELAARYQARIAYQHGAHLVLSWSR